MRINRQEIYFAALAFALMTALVFAQMPHAFLNLSSMAYGASDDGLKTYFTYLYHLKFDTSYLHFTGMNYPYGEQIIFTDNQPSVVIPVMAAMKMGLSLSSAQALFNGLILGSLLLTAPVAYLIGRHFQLSRIYSLALSLMLSLFSPQIIRLPGHEGLSHTVFLPLIWLLLLKFFERPRWPLTIAIAVLLTFFSGIHPYNLLIALSMMVGLWLFSIPKLQKLKLQKKDALHFVVQLVLPVVLFGLWARLGDPIRDRVVPQTSAFYYRAYFESVFLPYEGSPFRPLLDRIANLHEELPIEALAYVGLTGFFALIYLAQRFILQLYQTRRLPPVHASLAAGVLALLYSLGYPWRPFGEELFRHLGPIAQFRALGRFAWVFFWIYNVYIFTLIAKAKKPLVFAAFALTAFEAYSWSHPVLNGIESASIQPRGIAMTPELKALIAQTKIEDFQAFIPLPYFQAGSEGLVPREIRERNLPRTFADAMGLAYETGLPMVAQALSRTSIRQSNAIFSFMMGQQAELRKDLPNAKPFLLVVGPEKKMEFEYNLVARAKLLTQSENYQLLSLSP